MVRHRDTEMIFMKEDVYTQTSRNRRHGMSCRATWGRTKVDRSSSGHHPRYSPRDKCEGLLGAQDTGTAQGGAASHSVYIIYKFTPNTGQRVPQNKTCLYVGNPSGEKKQEIGHSHVGENYLCGPLSVAKQDWSDIIKEENDIKESPNHSLQKKGGCHSQYPCGS